MKEEEITQDQSVQGPGRILREERERRGLTQEDISDRTRLRSNVIQAIEDEAWDSLPSPAFVRGFLKNYAKALSVDEKPVLEAYGKKISVGENLARMPGQPLRVRRRGPFLLLFLLAAVAVFTLWKIYGPLDTSSMLPQKTTAPVVAELEKGRPEDGAGPVEPQAKKEEPADVSAPADLPKQEQPEPAVKEPAAAPVAPAAVVGPQTLKAKVSSRTWVKVYVDDLSPREYMFQPGQQPEWTASRGFYLIIGNASGIELEWNGQAVPALGNAGQVVRIRLPKEFRYRAEGN
jgi:cytoskeleton protein RodZ